MKNLVIKRLLRRSGKDGKGVYIIYFRFQLVWDGVRYPYFESSTKISITTPKNWDSKAQQVKGSSDAMRRLNQSIKDKEKAIHDYWDVYRIKTDKDFNFTKFRGLVNAQMGGKYAKKYNPSDDVFIHHLFDRHVANGKPKGGDFSSKRIKRYEFIKKQVIKYCKQTYRTEKVPLDKLGKSFYNNFRRFIQKDLGLNQETLKGYMKVFAAAVNSEWERGDHNTKNPFLGCTTDGGKTKREALSHTELKTIQNLSDDLLGESVAFARDLFLFQAYSGISFCDTQALTRDYLMILQGEEYLVKDREKNLNHANSNFFSVPVSQDMNELLKKFANHPKIAGTNRLIPPISNSNYNKHLKIIKAYAGIKKNLSTHIGRHTFACLFLEGGGSLEVLMKLLGHSRISQTQEYGKITPVRVSKEVRDAMYYLSNRDTRIIPISAAKTNGENDHKAIGG